MEMNREDRSGEEHDIGRDVPAAEREAVLRLAERLQRERPVPAPTFRGDLRRRLVARPGSRTGAVAERWRTVAATYAGLGVLGLAVAAVGVGGLGPFAA